MDQFRVRGSLTADSFTVPRYPGTGQCGVAPPRRKEGGLFAAQASRKAVVSKTLLYETEKQCRSLACEPSQQPSRPAQPTSIRHLGSEQLYSSVAPPQSIEVADLKPRTRALLPGGGIFLPA